MSTLGIVGDVVTTDVIILGGVLWLAFIIVWLDWFATKERRELLRELRKRDEQPKQKKSWRSLAGAEGERENMATGTQSNITYDLTRLDKEYLVSIGHHFWVVFLTDAERDRLTETLQQLATQNRIPSEGIDATYSVIAIGHIREHPDYVSMEEYLNELSS